MVSPLTVFQEDQRELHARDDKYYKQFLYFFELRVPPRLANGVGTFYFPLAIAPESYRMETQFEVSETQTQGGGLYVEEDGIVRRTIHLEGTTGFFPRRLPDTTATPLTALSPDRRSFTRQLQSNVLHKISGQRHFHYLQDAVFNTYGDLKQDPATSEETVMVFHNLKDEESWTVVPLAFTMKKEQRILYRYDIQLLVVGTPDEISISLSEDKTLLDEINDVSATVQKGIDLAQGALTDLTALADDLEGSIKNVAGILGSVGSVLSAASDFVEGVTDIIETPYAFVGELGEVIDEALALAWTTEESVADVKKVPDNVVQKFRSIKDGLERIGIHPSVFSPATNQQLLAMKDGQELGRSVSDERLAEAAEGESPTTLAEAANLGTKLTPGDVQSAKATWNTGRAIRAYTGSILKVISAGDTLVGLAARYLGDARLWTHIAAANGLKPPFITQQAEIDLTSETSPFSGALGVGNKILIPSYDRPPSDLPILPVLGVQIEESAEVHLLGVDVALEVIGGRPGAPLYDVAIDVEGGSNGPKLVEGIDNLAQGMTLRMIIEKGTDVLFRQVGLGRIVGTKVILTDFEAARAKTIESIKQDPRIASVRAIDFSGSSADSLVSDITAEVRGFTEQANVKVTL
jgi:hypothetical protein